VLNMERVQKLAPVLLLAAAACGPSPFDYDGTPGQPVPANFGSDGLADISASVNGGPEHALTADTGAPMTILDSSRFADHADGTHQDDIAAFELVFHGVRTVSYKTFGDSDGVLGGDILRHFAFSLDYEGDRVWLSDPWDTKNIPADVKSGAEVKVPFQLRGGGRGSVQNCSTCGSFDFPATRVMLRAAFEGGSPLWVLVDTGASGVILSGDMFDTLAADPQRPRIDGINVVAINDGNQASFITRLSRLELVGVSGTARLPTDDVVAIVIRGTGLLEQLTAEVGVATKALIGATLLDHYLTTIDYQSGVLRFQKYDDADTRNPGEWLGAGFQIDVENGEWTVYECYTNKDAYARGIRVGDVIEQIDNAPLAGQNGARVQQILDSYRVGDRMHVTWRRGAQDQAADVLVEDLLPHYLPPQ
jgi:hypothetical protein